MRHAERIVTVILAAACALASAGVAHAQHAGEGGRSDRAPARLFPSLRVGAGIAFTPDADADLGVAHDLTLGFRRFRPSGLLWGADVGYTLGRRSTDPGLNAALLGAPIGWNSARNRVQLGLRADLLAGRSVGLPTFGLRGSAFVGVRHSLFLEGGVEQRWDDGRSRRGGRLLLVVDLGVLVSSSSFLRAALH